MNDQLPANDCASSSSTFPLRIDYSAGKVTATVLPVSETHQATTGEQAATSNGPANAPGTSGPVAISAATLLSQLGRYLASLHGVRSTASILRRGGVILPMTAPDPGTAVLDLYAPSRYGRSARRSGRTHSVLLAVGRLTFSAPGSRRVYAKLTRQGRTLLRHATRVKIGAHLAFTPAGGSLIVAMHTFLVRR